LKKTTASEPIKPLLPVTKTRIVSPSLSAALLIYLLRTFEYNFWNALAANALCKNVDSLKTYDCSRPDRYLDLKANFP